MKHPLKGRSLLNLTDFSPEEIRYLLDLSVQIKEESRSGDVHSRFAGKTLAMLFEKRSTRTRAAFETAFGEEAGHPVFLSTQDIQLGAKETIEDTARVLGRMFSIIEFRGFKQEVVEALAEYSGVPVINGLTDLYHPTQALADLMTLEEETGPLKGKRLAFVGDGRNNVARSLMVISAKMGVDFAVGAPTSLQPDPEFRRQTESYRRNSGAALLVTNDPEAAVDGADAVYTDVWVSMGEESAESERLSLLKPYQVNESLMKSSGKDSTIFLHCLPAVKDNEVTTEVFEGPKSRVFEEAENRKHTIKAVMLAALGSEK